MANKSSLDATNIESLIGLKHIVIIQWQANFGRRCPFRTNISLQSDTWTELWRKSLCHIILSPGILGRQNWKGVVSIKMYKTILTSLLRNDEMLIVFTSGLFSETNSIFSREYLTPTSRLKKIEVINASSSSVCDKTFRVEVPVWYKLPKFASQFLMLFFAFHSSLQQSLSLT